MKAMLSQGSGQVSSHLTKMLVVGEAAEAHDNTADKGKQRSCSDKMRWESWEYGEGNSQIKI